MFVLGCVVVAFVTTGSALFVQFPVAIADCGIGADLLEDLVALDAVAARANTLYRHLNECRRF